MLTARTLSALASIAALVAVAAPAHAAPTSGSACTSAGMIVHDDAANVDLKCSKSGGTLVWKAIGNVSGSSPGGGGLKSSASIPKVIKNWGLALTAYDLATGMAGVMRVKGVDVPTFERSADDNDAYSRIIDLYGATLKSKPNPSKFVN